jgi:NAD(P)-dependent dehydrogenase (short-subunit alcohol dehydrogenase family)
MTLNTPKYALITGASSGIGQATALAFAQAGFNLILLGRSPDKLAAVAQAVGTVSKAAVNPITVQTEVLDLADLAQVRERIAAIVDPLPGLDIVINNAGMGYTGDLIDTPLAAWQQVLDLNLTSVFQVIQGVLPKLREQPHSTIINIASVAGHQAFPNWGAYCVSKFGLVALSKTLAQEERRHGIRVVTVSPGSVNTPIWDTPTVQADFDRSAMLTPEVVAQSILHTALLPPEAVVESLVIMPSGGAF